MWHRIGLQGSFVQAARARGVPLPRMRQRYQLPTEGTATDSVPSPPSSEAAEGPNAVRQHPIALDHLGSGHFPADAKQDRNLGYGAGPTPWGVPQHRLATQAQDQGMRERDDSKPLTGSVQVDDAFWRSERRGGKRGRGTPGNTPSVAAVACSPDGRPLAMRMTPLQGFRSDCVDRWARQHLSPDAEATSDGLQCFRGIVESCPH